MARPIKETPILTGKDASNFLKAMECSKDKRVTGEEKKRIESNFHRLKSIAEEK